MRLSRLWTLTLITAFLSGCMMAGPDYLRQKIDTPDSWPGEKTAGSLPAEWWKSYNDGVLNKMVEEAIAHNANLALAVARIDEFHAQQGIVSASRFPDVTARADRLRNRISEQSATFFPGIPTEYSDLNASINASWELDFWGKYRRSNEAARADLLATEFNRDAVQLALIADVSRGYFNLRALDAQVGVTRETVATRLDALVLQRKRFEAGIASELELHQVEAETAAAQALLPTLETRLSQQETALSVLLGRSPRAIAGVSPDRDAAIETLTVPLGVPAGLPSDILEKRPDLREAEQRLIAANARIGVARTAYYPSISLTGSYGTESASLADLFTAPARIWQFSASAAQLVFDAGRSTSQVKAASARQRQALAEYQLAIQNAFKDALDALVAQRKARERFEAVHTRVEALKKAFQLAQLRYNNGAASQLEVLDAERGYLDSELNRIDAQRAQLAATADLFKALGGGWSSESYQSRVIK